MVLNVTVDDDIGINGNIVTRLRLYWGEPFNNLDPIVNYTLSCLSDGRCPSNFTTTGNTALLGNLTTMTNYRFSVVATNSIGSGEAGVVMITTPLSSKVTSATMSSMDIITSIVGMTTTLSENMIATSSKGMTITTSSEGMTTASSEGMTTTTSSKGMTTTTTTTTTTTSGTGMSTMTSGMSVY